jgi:hypothetical protein
MVKCKTCGKYAIYGEPNGNAIFCKDHKTTSMIDVKNKRCEADGCQKCPTYNEPGETVAKFCKDHKTTSMIDVKNKRCEVNGCQKRPNYNEPGETVAKFCKEHKTPSMIDVKHKRCEADGCQKCPTYNEPGETVAKFCKDHKTTSMIYVINKRCEADGCQKQPYFNEPGETVAKFCKDHKTTSMIDVKSKRCEADGCQTIAWYGFPGKQKTHCAVHKIKGKMIPYPRTVCKTKNCKEIALYGINKNPFHCESHKEDGEINLIERPCVSCGLLEILDKNNNCYTCDPTQWNRIRLAKQNALMEFLDKNGFPGDSTDKMINGGTCGRERPDRVYDLNDKVIIIECDENQHRERACDCEQTRMVNIGQSYGGTPVYFIRFNPDKFEGKDEDIKKRYKLLASLLKDIQQNRSKKLPQNALVSAIYLYYDDWQGIHNEEWKILLSFDN